VFNPTPNSGNPSRLILAEQLCGRSPARLLLEIDIGELLSVVVAHDKAGAQLLDRPERREAAFGNGSKVTADTSNKFVP
jgi:hypothetical protein